MTTGQQTQERRKEARLRCLKGARVVLPNGNSTLTCRVRNRSATGLRLVVDETNFVPQSFTLVLDGATVGTTCNITWRSANEIGAVITGSVRLVQKGYSTNAPMLQDYNRDITHRYPV